MPRGLDAWLLDRTRRPQLGDFFPRVSKGGEHLLGVCAHWGSEKANLPWRLGEFDRDADLLHLAHLRMIHLNDHLARLQMGIMRRFIQVVHLPDADIMAC